MKIIECSHVYVHVGSIIVYLKILMQIAKRGLAMKVVKEVLCSSTLGFPLAFQEPCNATMQYNHTQDFP